METWFQDYLRKFDKFIWKWYQYGVCMVNLIVTNINWLNCAFVDRFGSIRLKIDIKDKGYVNPVTRNLIYISLWTCIIMSYVSTTYCISNGSVTNKIYINFYILPLFIWGSVNKIPCCNKNLYYRMLIL